GRHGPASGADCRACLPGAASRWTQARRKVAGGYCSARFRGTGVDVPGPGRRPRTGGHTADAPGDRYGPVTDMAWSEPLDRLDRGLHAVTATLVASLLMAGLLVVATAPTAHAAVPPRVLVAEGNDLPVVG